VLPWRRLHRFWILISRNMPLMIRIVHWPGLIMLWLMLLLLWSIRVILGCPSAPALAVLLYLLTLLGILQIVVTAIDILQQLSVKHAISW
jgi:hypothetical protein